MRVVWPAEGHAPLTHVWPAQGHAPLPHVWPAEGHAPLTLVVMNRAETEQRLLTVDLTTGHTATLLRETDPAWINTSPGANWPSAPLPRWLPDGSGFLWASDSSGAWQLALHHADGSLDHIVTPAALPFLSLEDVDAAHRTATVLLAPDHLDAALYRVPLAGGGAPEPIAAEPGQHAATFNELSHAAFIDHLDGADGRVLTLVRAATGRVLATVPSHAETPPPVHVQFTTAGVEAFDAAVLRPSAAVAGRRYPVVLSVYAGPGVKTVLRTPRLFGEAQCLADQGFIVAALDGRGTPGRGHDWERATKGDLIDIPLADQVAGLQALATQVPQMDMRHVGVTGWVVRRLLYRHGDHPPPRHLQRRRRRRPAGRLGRLRHRLHRTLSRHARRQPGQLPSKQRC